MALTPKEEAIGHLVDARNAYQQRGHEFRAACEAYISAGGTYTELGRLLGITRQAAWGFATYERKGS
jgi:hypothetical protein